MDAQCQQVIWQTESELKNGNFLVLNVYGHSRGAVAALLLAKQLNRIDPAALEINLALLDPVPGNFIITSTLDFLAISLAKKTMDLRACKHLKRVLALYPCEPLNAFAAHAPLFTLYPEHTEVEEEIIPGCHSSAQYQHITNAGITFLQ